MAHAERGIDRFRELHVTTTWVTNEFKEGMTSGAKREIPILKNEAAFRSWLGTILLRRTKDEPQVAPYFNQTAPGIRTVSVPWDRAHLAAYVETADEFARWYKQAQEEATGQGRSVNITMVLARIGAVSAAANHPHQPYKHAKAYHVVTSKQRAIVDRIDELVTHGHTVLSFSMSPATVNRLASEIRRKGHDPVVLHGGIALSRRTDSIRDRVHSGECPIILATYGTCKTGLNLPQADRVILTDRGWTPLTEDQAIQRVMRSQQRRLVEVEIYELAGSLDVYQAQMVQAKREANSSAIDYCEQEGIDASRFLHVDTILGSFLEALAKRDGFDSWEWRREMVKLATASGGAA